MNIATKLSLKNIITHSVYSLSLFGILSLGTFEAEAKREATVIDSQAPIDAVSGDKFEYWNFSNDISELLRSLHGVTERGNAGLAAAANSNVNFRGINTLTSNPASTLVLIDGRRAPGISTDVTSTDLQRIEVIKDSKASIVFGSTTTSAAINILTKMPEEELREIITNIDASGYQGRPNQFGYLKMSWAESNPLGVGFSAYYEAGGERGAEAGAFYAEAVKLRYNLGGPLCDPGIQYKDVKRFEYELPRGLYYPSRAVLECFGSEMFGAQSQYDSATGSSTTKEEMSDFIYAWLNHLGFSPKLANIAAQAALDVPAKDQALPSGFRPQGYTTLFDDLLDERLDEYLSNTDNTVDFLDADANALFDAFPESEINYSSLVPHILNDEFTEDFTLPSLSKGPTATLLAFIEKSFNRFSQENWQPNDPLYKKPDTTARKVGGFLKKGFGALLGATGVGVGTTDDDAKSNDQWGLHEVGFTPMGKGVSAWDVVDGRGKNVIVAVIDSGLDINHPDTPRYLWRNEDEIPDNNIDDDANGYVDDIYGWNFVAESNDIDDDYGHGTFVAGIISANTDNGVGIAGVNPGAQIMTLKVSGDSGVARSLPIYRALRYAVDNGARVINISLGDKGLSRLEQVGINYAYAMGCVVVVAAGNQGGNIAKYGPPGARRAFSVASLNIDGTRRSSSNKGLMVSIAAPGESIYSLTAKNGKRDGQIIPIMAGDYHRLNGTSFAAPIVAGTASLILANYPYLTNKQVEDILLSSAMDTENPGWDAETGMGRLDARNALSMPPDAAFAPRITEWIVNRDNRGKVASVDVYGVVRGPVANYEISVGQGKKPSSWTAAFGPSKRRVEHSHIARLPGSFFKKGSSWSLRLTATSQDGQQRSQQVVIRKDS